MKCKRVQMIERSGYEVDGRLFADRSEALAHKRRMDVREWVLDEVGTCGDADDAIQDVQDALLEPSSLRELIDILCESVDAKKVRDAVLLQGGVLLTETAVKCLVRDRAKFVQALLGVGD